MTLEELQELLRKHNLTLFVDRPPGGQWWVLLDGRHPRSYRGRGPDLLTAINNAIAQLNLLEARYAEDPAHDQS